ncbi:hypothetical protein ADUPG1_000933, partial [Aduncisulcus paluster]
CPDFCAPPPKFTGCFSSSKLDLVDSPSSIDYSHPVDSSPGKQRYSSAIYSDDLYYDKIEDEGRKEEEEERFHDDYHEARTDRHSRDAFGKEEEGEKDLSEESTDGHSSSSSSSSSDRKSSSSKSSRYQPRASCDCSGCRNPFVHSKSYRSSMAQKVHENLRYLLYQSYRFTDIGRGNSPHRVMFFSGCDCKKCISWANKFWTNGTAPRGLGEKKCEKIYGKLRDLLDSQSERGQRTLSSLMRQVIQDPGSLLDDFKDADKDIFSKDIRDSMLEGLHQLEKLFPMLHAVLPFTYWKEKHKLAQMNLSKAKSKKSGKSKKPAKSKKPGKSKEKLHEKLVCSVFGEDGFPECLAPQDKAKK